MKKNHLICLLLATLLATACASQKKKDQTISMSGAFALYPLAVKWAEVYQKEHPEIRFNISGGGAGKGMADALAGTVDLGMFSREIAQEEKKKGVWWVGLTIDAVVPTISSENPFLETLRSNGLSRDQFKAVFIDGSVHTWGALLGVSGKGELNVFTRSDACGAAETWARYLGGKQENLLGIGVYGDPGLADAVAKDQFSIGFNNTIYAYDVKTGKKRRGMEIIPIDINGNGQIDAEENFYDTFQGVLNAIATGRYPSPPARELYFVSDGKPRKQAVLDFIRWCLTEGQDYVTEAGYVPINREKIDAYLNKLN